jgi:hypothetical protein
VVTTVGLTVKYFVGAEVVFKVEIIGDKVGEKTGGGVTPL